MTRQSKTTLAVGHVTHDLYGARVRAGGSAFFGARAFRALGARSRLVSAVGTDFDCFEELFDLDVRLKVAGATTTFRNSYRGRARSQLVGSVAEPVSPESLPAAWRAADVLFLAPVLGEVEPRSWLDAVRAPVVGVGLQGLLKRPGRPSAKGRLLVPRPLGLEPEILERLDVVFLSDEDVADFGASDLLIRLRSAVPIVVLTLGDEGSLVFGRKTVKKIGTFPVFAKDPTGAGDVFAAAFLLALAEGADACDAARLGSAAASVVVEAEAGSSLERIRESRWRAHRVPATEAAG